MFEYLICRHLIGFSLLFFEFFELFNKKILFLIQQLHCGAFTNQ